MKHGTGGRPTARDLVRLARPKHWIKNLLIFLPILFSLSLFNTAMLARALCSFFAFCLMASAIYVLNDLRDAPQDRLHEQKKTRPIASGRVSNRAAAVLCAVLLAAAAALNALAAPANLAAWACFAAYFAINLGYSFGLKAVPLLDVVILAAGFVLRVMYGGAVVGIAISQWLYLVIISFSLFLSFGKRRGELMRVGFSSRKALRGYTQGFLDKIMYLCLCLTILFYALWCLDSSGRPGLYGEGLIWSIPLVMLICIRYSMDVEAPESHADPVEVLTTDLPLILLVLAYGAVMFFVLYGHQLLGGVGA